MVEKDGEKKTRSSKSRRPRLPKSYRLQKKVPESTSKPSNKFKKFNCGSFNCTTEKLSSLLMCQKGYASFAFYAAFVVFILAFIYVLWKIVSANTSRSGQSRRPEASPKVSPTTTAPTWSEEDEEELKKFFPTTASFVPTNVGTREKIEPTSSPLNSPGPSGIQLGDTNSPTREITRPTQSQISQLGTYLPSLPRLLRGSVFGEDAVTPLYGRGRQNAVIGEDFTPFPATYPLTSRWPSMASTTTWKAKQQEQQLPWQYNRRQQMPFVYQRRNPLQSLMRNSELSDQFYGDRGQYSKEKEQSMKNTFDAIKRMPTLQRDDEEVKSAWNEEDKHLHTAKNHEDEQKRRHHRFHTQKHHHKHKSSNEESWIDAESEHTNSNDDQDEINNQEQDTLLSKRHHHLSVGARRGEDITIDENDLRDAESDDGNDHHSVMRHHRHHHGSHERRNHNHHEHDRHQPSGQQREDADDDNSNNYHTHHHHHTHHRHQLNSQQQNQDGDQEEKEEHRVHHHHHHHHQHHYHHHARMQQQSKKHFHHKNDLNEGDSETYRKHRHKRVHHHSVLNTEHAKRTTIIHHLKRHHLHHHHHHRRPHFHHHLPPPHRHHHHHYHHHHHHQQHHHHHQQHHQHLHQQKYHHHQHHHQHFHKTKNHKPDSTHQSSKHTPTTNPSLKHFHHILDYKHYLRFKQSHTVDQEVHGNWKNIRRKTKRCINIRTFSANGKVRLTRSRYRAKYLYTVLLCKVVQVRKRGSRHKSNSEYKTAQLCHKLYFITKGVVRLILNKPSKDQSTSSEYEVQACRPSKDVHFQAASFQAAFSHNDHSQRSDIPKHNHEAIIKVSLHNKSKKGKLPHKHKGRKHSKRHRNIKHGTKDTKRHHHKRAKHSKKHKKEKLNTKKRVSQKHSNNSKKDTKDKTQEDVFFGKLLNILTIASGNNKASNSSNNPLTKLKGALQKMKKAKDEKAKQLKKKHKTHSKGKKKHLEETKLPDVSSPKYIQKLLEKILPSVVSNVKADLQGRKGDMLVKNAYVGTTATVKPTTTPPTTKPTTTPSTTATTTSTTTSATTATTTATTTSTTTTKPTPKPTTKANGLEDELKDILPLLLKKAQLAKKTTTTQKPTTIPTTKPTTPSKTKQIKDLLARLKLGGIDLGGLVDSKPTREVKATANVVHTTVQQRLDELDGLPEAQPHTLQNDMDLSPISNSGPVSVLGNDPFVKNILCFGDSLTKGYYHRGRSAHPYSIQLARLLNANSQTRYNLVTSGKNGEMTHGSMIKRLPEVLGNSSHFDWVIILAGTNDVAHVKNFGDDDSFMNQLVNVWSPKIFQDIISLHESAYKYGSRTVLLTIPESAYEAWPQFRTLWVMRKKINQELREFARRSQGRTILCDLAMKLPRHSLSPQMQRAVWSDHLHFTPYGYDKMAGVIYQCMKPFL